MAYNLRNRNFLKILDFSPKELNYLLDLARDLKRAKYAGTEQPHLKGKNIAMIFEKTSTRTRCAFEVGAKDQGSACTCYNSTDSHTDAGPHTCAVSGTFTGSCVSLCGTCSCQSG